MIDATDELGLVTTSEAAALLGVTRAAVLNAIMRGVLPARRFGTGAHALWLTTRDDVAQYRAEHSEDRRRIRGHVPSSTYHAEDGRA
jgi:excisionase family DNA binding protein